VQLVPLGVSFSRARGSKLEGFFCHVSMRRAVRALSFGLVPAFGGVTTGGMGCICMCINVYVCVWACVYIYMYANAYICIYVDA